MTVVKGKSMNPENGEITSSGKWENRRFYYNEIPEEHQVNAGDKR